MQITRGLLLTAVVGAIAFAQSPPPQPAAGPGGADYAYAEMIEHRYGTGGTAYTIFEPASPSPKQAPVVVFLHGWSAVQPAVYEAWIRHIVRKGRIVIYPRYQAELRTPVKDFTPNAIAGIQAALETLRTEPGHVAMEKRNFAVVGHSMGGVLAASLAALAARSGLPQPLAVMCVEAGKTWGPPAIQFHLPDLSLIPPSTLLLAVSGEDDTLARDVDDLRIFRESTRVPAQNKDYVTLRTDRHGSPPLIADHRAPCAAGPGAPISAACMVNALDYYGTWKLFDGLADAAFYGRNREYALGGTDKERYMGVWSDGTPVKTLATGVPR